MAEINKPAAPSMTFEIRPEVEGGVYSNVASIVHNMNEFMLDFAVVLPGKENALVRTRVITNPVHAKQLLMALAENVANYERSYGQIDVPAPPPVVKGTQTLH